MNLNANQAEHGKGMIMKGWMFTTPKDFNSTPVRR